MTYWSRYIQGSRKLLINVCVITKTDTVIIMHTHVIIGIVDLIGYSFKNSFKNCVDVKLICMSAVTLIQCLLIVDD